MRISLACLVMAGVMGVTAAQALAQEAATKQAVPVYDAGDLTLDRYSVIERLWTGSWRAIAPILLSARSS